MRTPAPRSLAVLVLAALAGACGGGGGSSASATGTCPAQPPCLLAVGIVVRVFPAGAPGPIADATVTVRSQSGTQEVATVACAPEADASVCSVQAGPGRYDLSVGAPGYETAVARAEVTAQDGECCPAVNVAKVDVPLMPTK